MDRQRIERSIKGLSEWQMHVQAESDIDANISTAIEALKAQLFKEVTTSDTISRTEVVEHLRRMLEATVPNTDYDEGFVDGVEFGVSTVSTMPPIQPEPNEGYWIDKGIFNNGLGISWHCWECSKCHSQKTSTSNYCPNCGAKMKGEANE